MKLDLNFKDDDRLVLFCTFWIWREVFTSFVVKNDFRSLDVEKIVELFQSYLDANFEKVE